jgi:hypothetical protein
MRKVLLLTATIGLMAVSLNTAYAAPQADATATSSSSAPVAKSTRKARTTNCADRVMCRKLDSLSAKMSSLTDTVKANNATQSEFFTKQGAVSDQMLTSLKAIEAQGANPQNAILLSFADRQLAEGEAPATVANQLCIDAGFKAGKPVDVSKKSGWFSGSSTYLKSVVCTF